jgi:hypothetical protein
MKPAAASLAAHSSIFSCTQEQRCATLPRLPYSYPCSYRAMSSSCASFYYLGENSSPGASHDANQIELLAPPVQCRPAAPPVRSHAQSWHPALPSGSPPPANNKEFIAVRLVCHTRRPSSREHCSFCASFRVSDSLQSTH